MRDLFPRLNLCTWLCLDLWSSCSPSPITLNAWDISSLSNVFFCKPLSRVYVVDHVASTAYPLHRERGLWPTCCPACTTHCCVDTQKPASLTSSANRFCRPHDSWPSYYAVYLRRLPNQNHRHAISVHQPPMDQANNAFTLIYINSLSKELVVVRRSSQKENVRHTFTCS